MMGEVVDAQHVYLRFAQSRKGGVASSSHTVIASISSCACFRQLVDDGRTPRFIISLDQIILALCRMTFGTTAAITL